MNQSRLAFECRRHLGTMVLGITLGLIPLIGGSSNENDDKTESPVLMDPYSVSALFPAVEVRFGLAGENLLEPIEDRILTATIVRVEARGVESGPDLRVGDKMEVINGIPLPGKTLGQFAQLLRAARAKGVPQWTVRRGASVQVVRFDGDWLVPLPGLTR